MSKIKLKASESFCATSRGGGKEYKLERLKEIFNAAPDGAQITDFYFDISQKVDNAYIDLEITGELTEVQQDFIDRTNAGSGFEAI
ncbi:MAG: hypothetical protein KAJ29_02730 [Alphaproteobacteria bacterium]|nr:hypothetical protein [Alphaproteobacteria bacterium]